MKYIAERGLKSIRSAVHAAYSANQNTVEIRVLPMQALLDDLDLIIKQRSDLLAALEALVDWLGPLRDQGQQIGNLDMTLVDQARAAVAKSIQEEQE